ncbi:unnamed protein product [Macrosiphum euphorbiae]|nr:unnamed protein product [Macrosiphum euphorbiae]
MDRNSLDQNCLGSNSFCSPITPGPSIPLDNENSQIQHQPVPSQIIQRTIMNMKEEPLFYSTDYSEDINCNRVIRMKQEAFFQSTVREHFQRKINKQQSSVSIAPHNSQASNNSPVLNIKQETNFQTNLREINSTNNINLLQRNGTIVSTTLHTYIPSNNIISNPGQTEILSYTMDRNSLDQNGLGSNSFSSPITPGPSMPLDNENPQIQHQPVPSQIIQSTIMNMKEEPLFYSTDHSEDINCNRVIRMKQEAFLQSTVREHFQRKINKQQSSVSIAPHNSIANNNSPVLNIKQETNFPANLREINCTNNINLLQRNGTIVSTALHTYIPSNNIISNPGQTEILSYTMDRNSLDQNGIGSNSFSSPITPGPSMPLDNENPQIQHQPVPSQIIQSTIMNMKEEPLFYSTDYSEDINCNRVIRMKQEAFFQSTVREHFQRKINKQQSSVSIAPHNSQASNNSPVLNIKQETNFQTNLREINSTNNINLLQRNGTIVSTTLHTYIPSNNIISNPGQTEILSYTMDRNSLDQNGLGSNSFSSPITPGPSMPLDNENPQIQHQPVPSQIIQSKIMNMKEEPLFYSTDHSEDINCNRVIRMKRKAFFQSTVREHCRRKINK